MKLFMRGESVRSDVPRLLRHGTRKGRRLNLSRFGRGYFFRLSLLRFRCGFRRRLLNDGERKGFSIRAAYPEIAHIYARSDGTSFGVACVDLDIRRALP